MTKERIEYFLGEQVPRQKLLLEGRDLNPSKLLDTGYEMRVPLFEDTLGHFWNDGFELNPPSMLKAIEERDNKRISAKNTKQQTQQS
jgi:hypothetical protein